MSDPIGEFTLEHKGTTYLKTDDGLDSYANFAGTATGYGAVFGTLKVSNPLVGTIPSSGACTWTSQAFLDDGTIMTGYGEGTFEQHAGLQKWKVNLEIQVSNGDSLRSEGEIDLETLTYSGAMYEA